MNGEVKSPVEKESDSNNIAFGQLIKAINSNIVFAFIGAGSSKKLGYPLWEELIGILEEAVKTKGTSIDLQLYKNNRDHEKDPLWYAEVLKSYLDESEFYSLINKTFRPQRDSWTPFHQKLIKIPFRHYITTNYDTILERASYSLSESIESFCWNDKEMLREFFQNLNDPRSQGTRYIFHIHGIYDKKDSIILTERDYMKLYFGEELAGKILWSIISSFKMLFIGFSMSDLDLLSIFRKARWEFGRGAPQHFAIVEENNIEARITKRIYLRDKYGIDPIFFSRQDKNANPYIEEENIIEKLVDLNIGNSLQRDANSLIEISRINQGLER